MPLNIRQVKISFFKFMRNLIFTRQVKLCIFKWQMKTSLLTGYTKRSVILLGIPWYKYSLRTYAKHPHLSVTTEACTTKTQWPGGGGGGMGVSECMPHTFQYPRIHPGGDMKQRPTKPDNTMIWRSGGGGSVWHAKPMGQSARGHFQQLGKATKKVFVFWKKYSFTKCKYKPLTLTS